MFALAVWISVLSVWILGCACLAFGNLLGCGHLSTNALVLHMEGLASRLHRCVCSFGGVSCSYAEATHSHTEKWHLRAQTVRTESISQKDWDNIIELEFILGTRLTTRERFLENANGALGFSRSG